MALAAMNLTMATLDWISVAFDAPLARAVVFGVHIDEHLVVEVLLVTVILFQLTRKSYKSPKKPLKRRFVYYFRTAALLEIYDLCEEWVPEPLHPPIAEDMKVLQNLFQKAFAFWLTTLLGTFFGFFLFETSQVFFSPLESFDPYSLI
ncbi:hypothetical protein C4D60_Mb04t19470 [Musa balbisiana]|uniref:Uncharacterized protein n=1 Tax=Musa balbisiana TaxID=52838 RepID=A0A4S8KD51_MUSBA|nr:hypothetical protein C4D60_Mb04t19470 [Musa balbisiana]